MKGMPKKEKFFLVGLIVAIACALVMVRMEIMPRTPISAEMSQALAAIDNPSTASSGYEHHVFSIPYTLTSGTVSNLVRWKTAWPERLLGVRGIVKDIATSGSATTVTVNVKEESTTVLTTPLALNGSTVSEASITDYDLADEAVISINFTVSGTGSVHDPTVELIMKRK